MITITNFHCCKIYKTLNSVERSLSLSLSHGDDSSLLSSRMSVGMQYHEWSVKLNLRLEKARRSVELECMRIGVNGSAMSNKILSFFS